MTRSEGFPSYNVASTTKRTPTVPRTQLSRYPASWLGVALRSGLRFAPPRESGAFGPLPSLKEVPSDRNA